MADDQPGAATVDVARDGAIWTITINRPEARNAVDGPTAEALATAFSEFDADPTAAVAILTGAGGTFCAGADLKALSNPLEEDQSRPGPMGPSRLRLDKPVISAIEGHAVAGGLELALWSDLRVAADSAIFGVFCRRWGVPLIDGGTVRLSRVIGLGRALDLILTGRAVDAAEALGMGLVNRVVATGEALTAARALAERLAALPQACLRQDRRSTYQALSVDEADALAAEFRGGLGALAEGRAGAARFAAGEGRGGSPRN